MLHRCFGYKSGLTKEEGFDEKSMSAMVLMLLVLSGAQAKAAEFLCTSSTTIPNYGPTDLLGAIRGSIRMEVSF